MNSIAYKSNHKNNPSAGIQAQVNLKHVARCLIGEGIPGGLCDNHFIPAIDPDYPLFQVFETHYWNPETGNRGGAIKLVQILKSYSKQSAIAYLEGFRDGSEQ